MYPVKAWIIAARPKTLPFGIAPVILGSALGLNLGYFSWVTFFICFFSALFLQIGANYANDVFDFEKGADSSERIGPLRAVSSGMLSAKDMKLGMVLSFSLAFLIATPLIYQEGWILALIFLAVVLIALGYSTGPLPFSYLGLGEVINTLFMAGLPTMLMCYMQCGKILPESFLIGICLGGLTSAVMCLNNLRDEFTDKKADKRTLVVRFGRRFGQYEFAFLTLYPFFLPLVLIYFFALPITVGAITLLIFPCIPLISATFAAKRSSEFSQIFPKSALLALIYTLTFTYGLIV